MSKSARMESALPAARFSFISSAPRGVRVEELGLYPASGRAPGADARAAHVICVLALLLTYAVLLVAIGLALGALGTGRPWAAVVALVAGVVAFFLAFQGEAALDAQALDEIEGQ